MALTIDTGAQVFTFINTFHTDESRQAALVASLQRFTEEATASLPGFVGAAVHTSVDGARVVNYVQWRTAADMHAMRADPRFALHMAEVTGLADRVEPVVFEVAYVRGVE
jgi:heme-degrading monooxygenase HmoA